VLSDHEERASASRRDAVPVRSRRDRGATYVELLVSIVLIGTSVVATLVAVRATLTATSIDNERAEARVWLLEAASQIEATTTIPCTGTNDEAIRSAYAAAADVAAAARPANWTAGSLLVKDVTFLGRTDPNAGYAFGDCLADPNHPHLAQLVKLEVTMPSGEVETLETVKS
jgi:type II secretory pathway pseudopilin PulG